jgi:hypothetical protein
MAAEMRKIRREMCKPLEQLIVPTVACEFLKASMAPAAWA